MKLHNPSIAEGGWQLNRIKVITLAAWLLVPLAGLHAAAGLPPDKSMAVLPPHPWGVFTWLGGDMAQLPADIPVKGIPLVLHWAKLEPQQGKFAFEKEVRAPLEHARDRGQYVLLKLWVAPDWAAPPWLYELGVPRVEVPERIDPTRKKTKLAFPYYFSPIYKEHFHRTIQALGDSFTATHLETTND
jgi:Beta-galactosidase